jgi:osmotically-inducible protein OsmY
MTGRGDSEIKRDVLQELKWDSRVEETEVGVEVHRGVVTLTGTVSSYGKRMAAQEAAHRVAGVLDVANDIQVKRPSSLEITDTDIAQAVRHALEWDVQIPHERIRSTVSNGWVTLEGNVDLLREREDAERAVRYLKGVTGVQNLIQVCPKTVEPQQVQQMIEEVLARRAAREAERIHVTVGNGDVTISGRVRSFAERRAILGAISHAPGVHTVKDHLLIETYS